ncbi:MAG: polysaccharide deacetylase family protein [Clostridia bacterium]|nr:polysaccharide deacetylase family protein [Clostridia bacterium]
MKKIIKSISILLVFLFVCGCASKTAEKPKEKPLPAYKTEFPFSDKNTFVTIAEGETEVTAVNTFESRALSLYDLLLSDSFTPIKNPDTKDLPKVNLNFYNVSPINGEVKNAEFSIAENNIITFCENDSVLYFMAKDGTYKNIEKRFIELSEEKDTYLKAETKNSKTVLEFLKNGNTVSKLSLNFEKPTVYVFGEDLLRIETQNKDCYYYDRRKCAVSKAVSTVSDYKNGYICYADKNKIKLINISDFEFNYQIENFDKEPYNFENAFVSIVFVDENTVDLEYFTDKNKTVFTQKVDISVYIKDYETKKAEKQKAALKAKKEAEQKQKEISKAKTVSSKSVSSAEKKTEKESSYQPPKVTKDGSLPPFSSNLNNLLMKYKNTRKGYGWKGSESRQNFYSKFNAYSTGDRSKKTVYLTFDEGYEYNNNTNKILNTLKSKKVKAVFFVTMHFAKSHPNLIKRMISEGHAVGNHSTNHPSFPSLSNKKAYDEVNTLHDYILKKYGYKMTLFRFPEGAYSDRMLALMKELNYKTVFWNCAYADWDTSKQPSKSQTRQVVKENTKNGTIYLFHAVSNTNVSMLPEIINTVRAKGYQFGLFGE